jgi:hypothetical protein
VVSVKGRNDTSLFPYILKAGNTETSDCGHIQYRNCLKYSAHEVQSINLPTLPHNDKMKTVFFIFLVKSTKEILHVNNNYMICSMVKQVVFNG